MRILLIEDDKELCDSICYQLNAEGYITDSCHDGEDGLLYALNNSYDVIILDRMLPELNGISLLKQIRNRHITTPVIIITAMDGIHDRIDGLDSGADDYLVKPFDIQELSARIRALIRRPRQIRQTDILNFSNLTLDVVKQELSTEVKCCSLSKKENELMEYFFRNPDQILPREMIMAHVWGSDHIVGDGNLDNYVHFLRVRLKAVQGQARIKTIHSVGYRLEQASK